VHVESVTPRFFWSQFDGDGFKKEACDACKTRADEVEQFEQALAQNVSEAPRTFEQFTSEHAAAAHQYAVMVNRANANILLASQIGWALRAMTTSFLCAQSALELHLYCLVSSVQRINSARVGHIVRHSVCKVVKNIASAVRLCVRFVQHVVTDWFAALGNSQCGGL